MKVYLRDPNSYTPLLESYWRDGQARSLTLGRSHEENMRQIAQFSQKDAKVFLFLNTVAYSVNTTRLNNAGLMLGRRRRRRANLKPALFKRVVFTGNVTTTSTALA